MDTKGGFYIIRSGDGFAFADAEQEESLTKQIKQGEVLFVPCKKVSERKKRNLLMHNKYFYLLKQAFIHWFVDTTVDENGREIKKSFDSFRKELQVMAGYGYPVWRLDGTFTLESDSISFDRMPQEEFERVFNDMVNQMLKTIFKGTEYDTNEKVRELVDQLVRS